MTWTINTNQELKQKQQFLQSNDIKYLSNMVRKFQARNLFEVGSYNKQFVMFAT